MNYPDYGDARLTKDGEGYVYWKGVQVEHYSHNELELEKEQADARELIARCEHLERLGIEVNTGSAIWYWSWFAGFTQQTWSALSPRLRTILALHNGFYEDAGGRFCWLHCRLSEAGARQTGRFRIFGNPGEFLDVESDEVGGFYHPLAKLGWHCARMGQAEHNGPCYATTEQLLTWLKAKGAL